MDPTLLGELASLATAVCWTGSATFFSIASRRLGSIVLNRTRLLLAVVFLLITHTLALGTPLPLDAAPDRWLWLGLSGIVGLAIGDAMLFQAYVLIGPRLGMLMMSTAPLMSALLALALLGERLRTLEWFGVLLTVAGIGWVVTRGGGPLLDRHKPHYMRGLILGFGAAVCQAGGLTLSKLGLGGDFPALSGVVIRMLAAFVALWGWTLFRREIGATFTAPLARTFRPPPGRRRCDHRTVPWGLVFADRRAARPRRRRQHDHGAAAGLPASHRALRPQRRHQLAGVGRHIRCHGRHRPAVPDLTRWASAGCLGSRLGRPLRLTRRAGPRVGARRLARRSSNHSAKRRAAIEHDDAAIVDHLPRAGI